MSLLYEAVKNNDLKALKEALKSNPSADELAGALKNAAEKGQDKQVGCLLDAGVNDRWAIAAAASFAPVKTVRLIYKRIGGDLNAALIGASAHGRVETVRFLLTTSADSLNEALADAALRGFSEIVRMLLKKGANPCAPVYGNQTALELAVKYGHKDIVRMLKKE